MRGYRLFAMGLIVCACGMSSGCKSSPGSSRTIVTPEPPVASAASSDGVIAEGSPAPTPAKTVSVVDRHPLFSKPRDYWESSGDNKIVKAAAATFVGVPVGMFGEVKQIIVGAPPEAHY
jgi:hypothetical protein